MDDVEVPDNVITAASPVEPPKAGEVSPPATTPMENQKRGHRPVVEVWGDNRLGHYLITEEQVTPFPGFQVVNDYYMPGGAFLLQALLESACCHASIFPEGRIKRPQPTTEMGRSRVAWASSLVQAIYRVYGPIDPVAIEKEKNTRITQLKNLIKKIVQWRRYRDPQMTVELTPDEVSVIGATPRGTDQSMEYQFLEKLHSLPRDPITIYRADRDEAWPEAYNSIFRERGYHTVGEKKHAKDKDLWDPSFDPIADPSEPSPHALIRVLSVDFEGFCPTRSRRTSTPMPKRTLSVIKARNVVGWSKERDSLQWRIQNDLKEFLWQDVETEASAIILSAEELRRYQFRISYRVSWERTVASLFTEIERLQKESENPASQGRDPYSFLLNAQHVIITFGCDGAVYFPSLRDFVARPNAGPENQFGAYLIADPSTIEGDHALSHPARVRGFDSIITCAVAHCVTAWAGANTNTSFLGREIEAPILKGIIRALKASRFFQVHGYSKVPDKSTRDRMFGSELEQALSPWLRCLAVAEVAKRFHVGEGKAALDQPVTLPFDILAAIIASGCPHDLTWYESSNLVTREQLRLLGQRIHEEWKKSGWFLCQPISEVMWGDSSGPNCDECERVHNDATPAEYKRLRDKIDAIVQGVSEGRSDFDRNWWSLLERAVNDSYLFNKIPGSSRIHPKAEDSESQERDAWINLAETVLVFGLGWLQGNPAKPFVSQVRRRFIEKRMRSLKGPDKRSVLSQRIPQLSGSIMKRSRRDPNLHFIKDHAILHDALRLKRANPEWPSPLGIVPYASIGEFQTIDRRESESLRSMVEIVRGYLQSHLVRPLNLGVFGPPGSGKNFAVEQVCNQLKKEKGLLRAEQRFETMTFNLSQFSDPNLICDAFEEIQDVGLKGHVPVVFWDEYDTRLKGQPLGWLSYFLGPMNDGLYFRNERTRQLPRAIFVFAGSMFTSYRAMDVLHRVAMESVFDVQVDRFGPMEWLDAKGPDFKSRLAGTFDVLGINDPETVKVHCRHDGPFVGVVREVASVESDRFSYLIRRALILRQKLWKRSRKVFTGNSLKSARLQIDGGIARAFLEIERYEHEARSIEQVVNMSQFEDSHSYGPREIPTASQLRVHVDAHRFEEIYKTHPSAEDYVTQHG